MFAVKEVRDPIADLRSTISLSRSFVPLKSLRHSFLEDLFLHVQSQSIFKGEKIFELGAHDKQFIYLTSGRVSLHYPSGRVVFVDAALSILPLCHQQPRPCFARAEEDCVVLRIDSDRLDRTLSWSQMTDYLISQLALNRDLDGHLEWCRTVLSSNLFFKVPPVNAEQIFSRMSPRYVQAREIIIEQGEHGEGCYFLKRGEADILRDGKRIAQIVPGRCFGEDALVSGKPRNATVRMLSDGELMCLAKEDFLLLLREPVVEELSAADIDNLPGTPIFLDVRTDAEYMLGHLAYSANCPLNVLALQQRLLSTGELYIVYCDSGRRSRAAAYFLGKSGFNVVCLKGGLHKQVMYEHLVSEPSYLLREGKLILSNGC